MQEIRINIHVRPHADLPPRYPKTATAFPTTMQFHARPGNAHQRRLSPRRARLGADVWTNADVYSQILRPSTLPYLFARFCCPCQHFGYPLPVGCEWPCIDQRRLGLFPLSGGLRASSLVRCGVWVGSQRPECCRDSSESETNWYGYTARPYCRAVGCIFSTRSWP